MRAILSRQINVGLDFPGEAARAGITGRLRALDRSEHALPAAPSATRAPPPTMPSPASSPESNDATRETLSGGLFRQWVVLLEKAIQRMKDRGVLVADAEPRLLAFVMVGAHRGGLTMAFTYRQEWPRPDARAIRGELSAHVRRRPAQTVRTSTTAGGRGCAHAGERHGHHDDVARPERGTGDQGAHREWRRQADVRARRRRNQHHRCAQYGRCERIAESRITSRTSAT